MHRHAQGMPMQHFARPLQPRNRSVLAARVRATLPMLHTQGLSRSPQTVPINRAEKRPYLVAGASSDLPTAEL